MESRFWKSLSYTVAFLLGLVGVLLCITEPMSPVLDVVVAQDSRVLQVWPDRSVGVASGLLEGSTVYVATEVLPVGAYRTSEGGVVRARTYLHFPLNVFPPGAEIKRATLYMYVDGSSSVGEVDLSVYRVLDSWGETGWSSDPATWPALLTSPIAVAVARLGAMTPTLPVSVTLAAPASTPAPTVTLTPAPPTSPLPTPTPFSTLTMPLVPLDQVAGTWLTWDVTVLVRAWLVGEVSDDGLALASAPAPDADPETTGGLIVARWLAAADSNTKPYLIAEFEVLPVTPTPTPPTSPLSTPTSVPVLPSAGSPVGWGGVGLLFIGMALLALGLIGRF